VASSTRFRRRGFIRRYVLLCECPDGFARSGNALAHASNIFGCGYEFEGDRAAIS